MPLAPLAGSSGIDADAFLEAHGTDLRMTVDVAAGRTSYMIGLYTPPKKIEWIGSETSGDMRAVHPLTMEHLLAYRWLVVFTLRRSPPAGVHPALRMKTSDLAAQVIRSAG